MRMLCSAGVLVGFVEVVETPLFAGSEVEWLTPQCEYRPTEYMQGWMSFGLMKPNGWTWQNNFNLPGLNLSAKFGRKIKI